MTAAPTTVIDTNTSNSVSNVGQDASTRLFTHPRASSRRTGSILRLLQEPEESDSASYEQKDSEYNEYDPERVKD
jgi:hypothetical protein